MEKLTIEDLKGKKIVFKISGNKNNVLDYFPKLTTAIRLNAGVSLYNNVCAETFEDRIQLSFSCSDEVANFIEESTIKDNTSSIRFIKDSMGLKFDIACGVDTNKLGSAKNMTLYDINELVEVLKKIISNKIMLL